MYVMVVGLNYRTTPIEIREKFTFQEQELPDALTRLKQMKSILEAVIISTCNRTEIYAVVDQLHTGEHFIKRFFSEWFHLPKEEFAHHLYVKQDREATEHLFHVIAGLDSMIVGETQILGQVREAFFIAQTYKTTGTLFNRLFKQAITFGKRVHTETGIGQNAVSISYAAVELTKKVFEHFEDKSVLIIGAGEMSELTAIHLHSQGVQNVMVANRTIEKAEELALTFRGKAYSMEDLSHALLKADIVISSTGADSLILSRAQVADVMKKRGNRPLFMIDIAVPRDLDPAIQDCENVYLFNIDDLQEIVDGNIRERQRIAGEVQVKITVEVDQFYQWVNTLGVIPLISKLREKSEKIQEETMKSLENKLSHLSERDLTIIRKHTKSIVNQMLKEPILNLKENAIKPDAELMMEYFRKIFGIEEGELRESVQYEHRKNKEIYQSERRFELKTSLFK
ncbi:glutamyl-tRNA reductase [Tepidibacillus fermentans]|uniref:Glutamyl-tRNA reductase n=1 Tax=Tepidibacillus fermentans TaxID=1281767 RepID=A0A4R3KIR7_9BACI|nr:glutamyl-tRNA reductase [Tepidibacillus fermentans]TCS83475.1 glutamyl-tRNA reductase [Tepidibacillus fermentans]